MDEKIQESLNEWEVHQEAVETTVLLAYMGVTALLQAYRSWGTKSRRHCSSKGYTRWEFEACKAEAKLKALKEIRTKLVAKKRQCPKQNKASVQTCNAIMTREIKKIDDKIATKKEKLAYYLKRVRKEK